MTPLEQVAALYGVDGWGEADYVAARATEEGKMSQIMAGFIPAKQARLMAESFRATLPPSKAAEKIAILDLLTVKPVRASASPDMEPVDDEFAHLWPPSTAAEDDRRHRQAIAASQRHVSDDDDYVALYGQEPPR